MDEACDLYQYRRIQIHRTIETELLGEKVGIERISTNGSMEKTIQLYQEQGGNVDAFGVGGIELRLIVGTRYLVTPMPVFDGRSFGTKIMETTLIGVAGKGCKLT